MKLDWKKNIIVTILYNIPLILLFGDYSSQALIPLSLSILFNLVVLFTILTSYDWYTTRKKVKE